MSKSSGTALKDAIKQFEQAKGCVAAEAEKARTQGCKPARWVEDAASPRKHAQAQTACSAVRCVHAQTQLLCSALQCASANNGVVLTASPCRHLCAQVELWGRVPPIEKLDATLSTLKNCKCVACGRIRGRRCTPVGSVVCTATHTPAVRTGTWR